MLPCGCTVSLQSPPSLTVLSDFFVVVLFCFVFVFFFLLSFLYIHFTAFHTNVLRVYTVVVVVFFKKRLCNPSIVASYRIASFSCSNFSWLGEKRSSENQLTERQRSQ